MSIGLSNWIKRKENVKLMTKINSILIIIIELIEGLQFLNEKGISSHNDIKKENILLSHEEVSLDYQRNIIISDFNVSTDSDDDMKYSNDLLSIMAILLEMMDKESLYNYKNLKKIDIMQIKKRVIDNNYEKVFCHNRCDLDLFNKCVNSIFQIIDYCKKGEYDRNSYNEIKNKFIELYNILNKDGPYQNRFRIIEFGINDLINRLASVAMLWTNIQHAKSSSDEKTLHEEYENLFNNLYEKAYLINKDNPFLIYNKKLFDYNKKIIDNNEKYTSFSLKVFAKALDASNIRFYCSR